MDIYNYLKKDHHLVAGLMDKVLATKDVAKRTELFEQIKHELTLHADTEEKTFYKAIEDASRSKEVHEKMDHADEEHGEIRGYLKKLSAISVKSEKWIETFGEFKHSVAHHVEEEEGDIFKKARKYLSEADAVRLAKEMDALKQKQLLKEKIAA